MAISCEEAKYMMTIAKNTNLVASMGFNYRYLSYVKALKQLIQNEELGEIVVIRLHFKRIALLGELRLLGEMIFKVIELVEPWEIWEFI